jgi:hypothetical protein
MEIKQTAVDWLFLMLNDPNRDQEFAKKLYDKAKEIEQEQHANTWVDSQIEFGEDLNKRKYFQEYYNETYGK